MQTLVFLSFTILKDSEIYEILNPELRFIFLFFFKPATAINYRTSVTLTRLFSEKQDMAATATSARATPKDPIAKRANSAHIAKRTRTPVLTVSVTSTAPRAFNVIHLENAAADRVLLARNAIAVHLTTMTSQ
jgi:hypothetical protein